MAKTVNVYTDEKAKRLMATFRASMAFAFLICWFEIVIIRPSDDMRREMAHLDPSEIIGSPFPLTNVTIFATVPVLVLLTYWTATEGKKMGWKILSFIKIMGLVFVMFGMCGIDLVATWQHTLNAALFLTTVLCCNLTDKRSGNILEELPFYDHSDIMSTTRLYMTLAICIPFSILSVLDHGEQKQRWPVPIFMGGTYGFAFGTILGLILSYLQNKKKAKAKQ
eukprot:CAMPEP_0116124988 /NCGR_PEP_ID=MMETSP0329-20121206/5573_1 /TAXON_ID=697910 /ORGANISM="Pseudo-nitzschia arenysensis, Strain B593" /LENGTH=222 /DNA_ID=CAMNT_0003619003 /DNA_START=73 /DNA_END=741 /DNA_ORIENTATION=-